MFLEWIKTTTTTPQPFVVNKATVGRRIEQVTGFPALKENEKFVINPRCDPKPKRDQFPTTTPSPQKKDKKKKNSKKKDKKGKKDKKSRKKKNAKG